MKYGPIGIHLGSEKVKISQVFSDDIQLRMVEMISLPTPEGCISDGYIKTPRVLGDSIGRAIKSSKFFGNRVMIAIPSEILSIKLITTKEAANLDRAIASRLSQMAFEHPEDLTFDYKIAKKEDDDVTAIVAVTNKKHIARIREMAAEADLRLVGTDLEMLAIYRLSSKCYKTKDKPVMIALFTPPKLKLAMFSNTVLSQLETTNFHVTSDPEYNDMLKQEFESFLEKYRKNNIVTEPPTIFLAGLPKPSISLEHNLWRDLGLKTTSIRWSELFNISKTYTNMNELINRFGAFSCSLGLSIADTSIPTRFKSPIIPDGRITEIDPKLLEFPQRIEL